MIESNKDRPLDRLDRTLIEACQDAEERICAEPTRLHKEYSSLSENSRCALVFVKQWTSDAALPIELEDLDTILILGFERMCPAGDHVHERILQGLVHLSSQPGDDTRDPARYALSWINNALTVAQRGLISSAMETLVEVMIVLRGEPDEKSLQTAGFLLAKLLDPDLGD